MGWASQEVLVPLLLPLLGPRVALQGWKCPRPGVEVAAQGSHRGVVPPTLRLRGGFGPWRVGGSGWRAVRGWARAVPSPRVCPLPDSSPSSSSTPVSGCSSPNDSLPAEHGALPAAPGVAHEVSSGGFGGPMSPLGSGGGHDPSPEPPALSPLPCSPCTWHALEFSALGCSSRPGAAPTPTLLQGALPLSHGCPVPTGVPRAVPDVPCPGPCLGAGHRWLVSGADAPGPAADDAGELPGPVCPAERGLPAGHHPGPAGHHRCQGRWPGCTPSTGQRGPAGLSFGFGLPSAARGHGGDNPVASRCRVPVPDPVPVPAGRGRAPGPAQPGSPGAGAQRAGAPGHALARLHPGWPGAARGRQPPVPSAAARHHPRALGHPRSAGGG